MSADPASPQVRITLRPLGSPLPLGIFALGIGMILIGTLAAGWLPDSEIGRVGLLLAAFVFPLELLAAVLAFFARDVVSATSLGLFAAAWLATGLTLLGGAAGESSAALGVFFLAFAAPVVSLSVVGFTGKPLVAILLAMSGVRAMLDGLSELTGVTPLETVAGYVAIALALGAWYAGTALLIEDLRREDVLPVPRVGESDKALDDEVGSSMERLPSEAGVRQQL